ncbi:MAG: hypothetical protein KAS72_02800 [Phycisphaerales bacterium]|nr:hypothetical protein [Phycisphaerales bacterium]
MINWIYFPKSRKPPYLATAVVTVFESEAKLIDSTVHTLTSNEVLSHLAGGLQALGFVVETGKTRSKKIRVPVLFGVNGKEEKWFEADAFNEELGMVVEVEAGRGVVNNQFLKDLFQACMMQGVGEFVIAVRNQYRSSNDFEKVLKFFETLYASDRLTLPLQGILVIGY